MKMEKLLGLHQRIYPHSQVDILSVAKEILQE
nr:MAG TPA: hypothetical protein [Caudoviricetes sp.]